MADLVDHNHLSEIADLRAEVVNQRVQNHDHTFKVITIGDPGNYSAVVIRFRDWKNMFVETADREKVCR
jgi:hypothetical protein